jgi:hypothetical protein
MNARVWKVALALLGSGFCALVYQTAWSRELRLIFGASTPATAAVLAIFMGGLGLGAALFGRRADASSNALALYAKLELVVSASAAATPAFVWLVRLVYVALGGSSALGRVGGSVVQLVLSALVLIVPTIAMGGTLPSAVRAVETSADAGRQAVAWLYGVNTLGAVLGSFATTFALEEVFGNRTTLWMACLLNVLIALYAQRLSHQPKVPAPVAAKPEPATERAAPPRFVLAVAGTSASLSS